MHSSFFLFLPFPTLAHFGACRILLPGAGIDPVSPSLQGRFLTGPPEKSYILVVYLFMAILGPALAGRFLTTGPPGKA